MARQRFQLGLCRLVQMENRVCDGCGTGAIGFGKNDVESNCSSTRPHEFDQKLGDCCTRPWPLTDITETFLVDIDNRDRPASLRRHVSWRKALIHIESLNAQKLNRIRIRSVYNGKQNKQGDAEQTLYTEEAPPAKPFRFWNRIPSPPLFGHYGFSDLFCLPTFTRPPLSS